MNCPHCKKPLKSPFDLLVGVAVALIPVYAMAGSIGADEYQKSGAGLALAGVVTAYRVWKGHDTKD